MIPLRDLNPTRRRPLITYGIIALNILVFLYEIMLPERAQNNLVRQFGVIPWRVVNDFGPTTALTLFTSMFLHGGFLHILSNMLYLYIFGDNVEDTMGGFPYLIFYLACGVGAALAQVMADPHSRIPAIGASGAIAGVLGAYLVFFPHAQVQSLVFFGYFARVVELPAILVLGGWFVLQLFNGVLSLGVAQMGGVAWFAHIGGFISGVGASLLCRLAGCKPRPSRPIVYPYYRNYPGFDDW